MDLIKKGRNRLYLANPALTAYLIEQYHRDLVRFRAFDPDFAAGTEEMRPRRANLTESDGSAIGVDSFSFTVDQKLPLGTLAYDKVGRMYRYSQAGAADLVAGNIVQRAAPVANHLANTPPVVAAGATSFSYTPGATIGAANLYGEGFLQVDTTPGNGYAYRISGHPAIASATAFNLLLDPEEGIQVALTAASRVGLHHNLYKGVIQCPTTVTGPTSGGAVAPITAAYYGWLQTRGPFPALINGTPAVGTGLVTSVTTAGALDVCAAAAAEINFRILAHMMQVGVSGKNNLVNLMLD